MSEPTTSMDEETFERMRSEMETAMCRVAKKYGIELEFDDHLCFWLREHVTID